MAKRICPFCKEEIKQDAIICKHCRSELPALPPKKGGQTWKGFILIMFILFILVQVFKESPPNRQSSSSGKKTVQKKTVQKAIAENWVLLRSGQNNDYYDKNSVIEIEKGIKEVYHSSHNGYSLNGLPKISKRQVRIDCGRRKFALGECFGWVGEEEVAHFYFNKDGWDWVDITENNFNPKLFEAVCTAK